VTSLDNNDVSGVEERLLVAAVGRGQPGAGAAGRREPIMTPSKRWPLLHTALCSSSPLALMSPTTISGTAKSSVPRVLVLGHYLEYLALAVATGGRLCADPVASGECSSRLFISTMTPLSCGDRRLCQD
jgi:hypothetical protein